MRLSNTLGLYSNRRYRNQFDVTLPEWRVMSIIVLLETTSAREISRALATDKAWVGLTVQKLEQRGFVRCVSDKQDGRRFSGTFSSEHHTETFIGVVARSGTIFRVDHDGYAVGILLAPNRWESCYLHLSAASRVASCTEFTKQ